MSPSGGPVVGDLFQKFDFGQLPNAVNMPTYDRLCAFLRDDLKRAELVPPLSSVREVVEDIKKFNTSGTLCWLLAQETQGAANAQDAMGAFGSAQRVFAHCAKAVFAKVEMAVAAIPRENPAGRATAVGSGARSASSAAAPGNGDLLPWLEVRRLERVAPALQALDVCSVDELFFGVERGLVTPNELVANGASMLAAMRLIEFVSSSSA